MPRAGYVILVCAALSAAQNVAKDVAFEVAVVRRSQPNAGGDLSGGAYVSIDNARAELRNQTLALVVQRAYRLLPDELRVPGWLQADHWDIIGKLPVGSTSKQVPEMLQRLLAERFKMVAHFEERSRPTYELVLGKGRLSLQPSSDNDPGKRGCRGFPHHVCQGMTMADLAALLTSSSLLNTMGGPGMTPWALNRPVTDKTGLAGSYDFVMDFGRVMPSDDHTGPMDISMADAVDKLGLALRPATQGVQLLVVEQIQRIPTDN
jgi:uncharacterized protein (TIGR03435 family)